jgi:hypothetical protein
MSADKMKGAPLTPTKAAAHTGWLGPFDFWHRNKPVPFNPAYDPAAADRSRRVTSSMESDGFYDRHTREECATEWRRRYDALKAQGGKS